MKACAVFDTNAAEVMGGHALVTYLDLLASMMGSLANMRDLLVSSLQAAIKMTFHVTKVYSHAPQSSHGYIQDICIVDICCT